MEQCIGYRKIFNCCWRESVRPLLCYWVLWIAVDITHYRPAETDTLLA